jgi:hypothetical protein
MRKVKEIHREKWSMRGGEREREREREREDDFAVHTSPAGKYSSL